MLVVSVHWNTPSFASRVQPFDTEISHSESSVVPKLDKWLLRVENDVSAIVVTDKEQKKALLLRAVGVKTVDIFVNLPDKATTHDHAKAALTNYLKTKLKNEYKGAVFRRIHQEPGC